MITVKINFWTLNSVFLVYIFILMSVPQCLDYCSFVASFEIHKYNSKSNPVLFFKIVLAMWSSSNFHMNFRNSLLISAKNVCEILMEIALNLKVNLGSIVILTKLSLVICELGCRSVCL